MKYITCKLEISETYNSPKIYCDLEGAKNCSNNMVVEVEDEDVEDLHLIISQMEEYFTTIKKVNINLIEHSLYKIEDYGGNIIKF